MCVTPGFAPAYPALSRATAECQDTIKQIALGSPDQYPPTGPNALDTFWCRNHHLTSGIAIGVVTLSEGCQAASFSGGGVCVGAQPSRARPVKVSQDER